MKTTQSTSKKQNKLSKPTSSISGLRKELRKKAPKKLSKIETTWEAKMVLPVMGFVFSVVDDVNPRLGKLAKKDEYIIKGERIERKVWKLLEQCRRIK